MKMPKIPSAADIQTTINEKLAASGLGDYIESVTYLPKDAAPAADATHVLTLRSLKSGAKVEAAIVVKPGFVAMAADLALDIL